MLYSEHRSDNCGIYSITNIVNGKQYIGQSHNIIWRWTAHKSALRHGICSNRHLQYAWNAYGEDNFMFEVIELCPVELLDSRESYWIDHYNTIDSGYNIRSGGNSSRGWKMSDEGRKHISEALKGKKKPDGIGDAISRRQKEYYKTHVPATSIPVILLNTGERFVNAAAAHNKYPSADASAIHEQCKGSRTLSCGKSDAGDPLVWAYERDFVNMSDDEIKRRLTYNGRRVAVDKHSTPVVCLTNGKIFKSQKEASEYAGVTVATLNGCVKGRQKHAGVDPVTGERLRWVFADA